MGLALALAACASDSGSGSGSGSPDASGGPSATVSEGGDVALNEADVSFLQGMVPHHEQANEMAAMVEAGTDRPELAELASTILSTQTAEIDQMAERRAAWT